MTVFDSPLVAEEEVLEDANSHREPTQEIHHDVPRKIHVMRVSDVLSMAGAIAASLSLTTVIFTMLAPLGGVIGFIAISYIFFLATYALLVSFDETWPIVRDRVFSVAVHSFAVVVFMTLVYIVVFAILRGADALPHLNFFTQDMSLAGPLDPLSKGGIIHAIYGTLMQITIALAITIPLGLLTAVFLNEVPGAFSRFVRTIVEAMTMVVAEVQVDILEMVIMADQGMVLIMEGVPMVVVVVVGILEEIMLLLEQPHLEEV